MADTPTLNSRLRVLVAKTFRAEKLYASMKNNSGVDSHDSAKLGEIANRVRAEVWQQNHTHLRKTLNDALSHLSGSELTEEVNQIKDFFEKSANDSKLTLEKNKASLLDTSKRDEFAQSFRLSLELIRLKAHMQASQIISDELRSIVQASRKTDKNAPIETVSEESLAAEDYSYYEEKQVIAGGSSNVIPFRRR